MPGEELRQKLLKSIYRVFPFKLTGDCSVLSAGSGIKISCIINFYGRLDLLGGILHSLASQKYPRELFEVVLIEDKGGTEAGRAFCNSFCDRLHIVYAPLPDHHGKMGFSRNYGLFTSRGELILFLDDDTVILQDDFLAQTERSFAEKPGADALIPHGHASFAVIQDKYDFHDPYFMTSRCTAYRRAVLAELGGFVSDFVGQEDVEFVVRFTMAGKKAVNIPELCYYHPPLLVPNFRKPKAVGNSFYHLKSRYPLLLWLLVLMNCSRHALIYPLPGRRFREMGRFGIGFLAGIVSSVFKREGYQYN